MKYAYKIEHNTSGIRSIAIGEAENDAEECQSAGITLDEQEVDTRAGEQVRDLIEWQKKEITPLDGELLTDDEQSFARIYAEAYKRRFLTRQFYCEKQKTETSASEI